ncbi:hypothetical protein GCM10010468_53820 [Actinocorallia longicatena]|uniref:SPW repeat-containing protein n=1 Tax=Actinocorallia longicatena TaxID=111803 RepID=A0ABP6QG83_9ACTN
MIGESLPGEHTARATDQTVRLLAAMSGTALLVSTLLPWADGANLSLVTVVGVAGMLAVYGAVLGTRRQRRVLLVPAAVLAWVAVGLWLARTGSRRLGEGEPFLPGDVLIGGWTALLGTVAVACAAVLSLRDSFRAF